MNCDLCVLTARDLRQARLFESQLDALRRVGSLPRDLQTLVVSDPPGPPLGTAGATLYALAAAADALGGAPGFAGRRVFVVHCGGLSQRLPQFAQLGKVFTPLPHAGWAPNPLLAEVLRGLSHLAGGARDGVLVACGDALYTCDALPDLVGAEAVAFVAPAPPEQAAQHGVYDWSPETGLATRVFQKPGADLQRQAGLLREGSAWLDSGVVYLAPAVVSAWLGSLGPAPGTHRARVARDRARWAGVEFYEHVTGAMIPGGPDSPARQALSRFRLRVQAPAGASFLHFGTTAELLHLLCSRRLGSGGLAWVHPSARLDPTSLVESAIVADERSRLGPHSLVHHSSAEAGLELAGRNHVLGIRGRTPLRLPEEVVLYQAPVRGPGAADALVVLGVGDNPKQRAAEGIRYLGGELLDWAGARGLEARDVWPDLPVERRTLWNARLFPVGASAEVLGQVPRIVEAPGRRLDLRPLPRLSMEDVQRRFDVRRWRRFEERLHARLLALSLTGVIEHGSAARDLLAHAARTPYGARVAAALYPHAVREREPLRSARLWQACAILKAPPVGDSPVVEAGGRTGVAQARAFRAIQAAVGRSPEGAAAPRWLARAGAWAEADAPVRVDLAGGWTDTPPQALELGGAVINVGFLLDGRRPVRARAEVLAEPVIELVSHDLGERRTVASAREAREYADPADPFALHRAALCEAGMLPPRLRNLDAFLRRAGAGLRLETEARVPKGSGLGTSSILGATALAALGGLNGAALDLGQLCNQVLRLEQRLTTGGGWQDQVGALDGGFKLARTAPGADQTPSIRRLPVPESVVRAFEERVVLHYTGIPRLARNVLQRVVARYLLREPAVLGALAEMRDLVARLEDALLAGDLPAVGAVLSRSWELNRLIEPTASNPDLERLFAAIRPHCLGAKLAGAGGGGFLLALAREPEDREPLRRALVAAGADPAGGCEARVAPAGLQLRTGRGGPTCGSS